MASKVLELEAQLHALKEQQAGLAREIKSSQRRSRRQNSKTHLAEQLQNAGAHDACPKLDHAKSKTLLLLLELANLQTDIVVSYALGQGRPEECRSHGLDVWSKDTRQHISAAVQLLYLGVQDSQLASLYDDEKQTYALCKYVVEYHLFQWLVSLNCDKGVYPRPSQILSQAASLVPQGAPVSLQQKMKVFFLGSDRAARFWVVSFKQRWGVTVGLPPAGEDLDREDLVAKVAWPFFYFFQFLGSSSGARNGYQNWAPAKETKKGRPQN